MADYQLEQPEWLTISEASQFLRVSTSTLRRWTDKQQVPVSKTPGGHRRYSLRVIRELSERMASPSFAQSSQTSSPLALDWTIPSTDVRGQAWYPRFAPAKTVKGMRSVGQRLLGLLIQYVTRRNDDSRFLHEGREVGNSYGNLAARAGATAEESVEAFLFFRRSFSQTALQVPRIAHSSDADEIIRFAQRIDGFMDEVLAGMIAGYESARRQRELGPPSTLRQRH